MPYPQTTMVLIKSLAGGISFFSGRHGWACDNVKNYEVRSLFIDTVETELIATRSSLQTLQL